jgi:hypothetical protein
MAALRCAELRQGDSGSVPPIRHLGRRTSLPGGFLNNLPSELIRIARAFLGHARLSHTWPGKYRPEKSKLDHYRPSAHVAEPHSDGVCWSFRMARNARPTAAKREREKALIERRQQKFARRQDAKTKKPTNEPDAGEDPDIAHIKPGPQPLADWQIEE